jgi:hypothetical protein
MADETAVVAESSPAIDEGSHILSQMTHTQREHWFSTGELPAPTEQAEAESADTQESTAASETPADAESAPSQEHKRPGQKLNAEDRIKQLNARLKDAEERIRELSEKPAEATDEGEEEQQTAAPAEDPRPERPKRPKLEQFDDYEAFDKANDAYEASMDEYTEKLTVWKARELAREQETQRASAEADRQAVETMKAYNAQVVEAEAKYSDFREVVGKPGLMLPAIAQLTLVQSERGAEMAYLISKDPKLVAKLIELNKTSTVKVIKEIGKLEAALEAADTETETPTRPNPPVRTTTRAPRPGYEATGTSGRPRDPVGEAVEAGDYRAFERAAEAADAERMRRRSK